MKAVLDIGKTNVKLQLVDNSGLPAQSFSRRNSVLRAAATYPHADVNGIWAWLMAQLSDYAQVHEVDAVIVTTHGATAALICADAQESVNHDGLVLPVLDYEFAGINECDAAYDALRPAFGETLSPALPAGLNLGRQLYWLQQQFATDIARVTWVLMYPQYWGWRLTGQVASEVSSLGCHTDLWSPVAANYSSLVRTCDWGRLFPPLRPAWQTLGQIRPELAAQTGLPSHCQVYVGLHDSNASYLRYLLHHQSAVTAFTVISTGTWTILMQAQADLALLNQRRDSLANCDIYGTPVACARFMGGREYEVICERLGGDVHALVNAQDVQAALDQLWMVTPDFSGGNGPFGGLEPVFACPVPASSAGAIATLYSALMIDQRLTDLQSTGPIYMEGAFLKNPLLCQLVAQLRSEQAVFLSADDTGTVQGAVLLTALPERSDGVPLMLEPCAPSHFGGLSTYRTHWYGLIARMSA